MQVKKNSFRELFKLIGKVNGYEASSAYYHNLLDVFNSRLSFKESKYTNELFFMSDFTFLKFISVSSTLDMQLKAVLAICGVFLGCCSNVVFLELIVRYVLHSYSNLGQ